MRINISNDEIYLLEPVGKQLKYWFESYNKTYLFKKATLKNDGTPVYNDITECMAQDVARLLNLDVAEYYLCDKNGEKGVISKNFLDNKPNGLKKEEFYDGVHLIAKIDPGFKNMSLENKTTHQFYTVDLVIRSVEKYGLIKEVIEMMVFDALIANRDRNPSNYGIIINHETKKVRLAPLYDNCTSLGVSMVQHRLDECIDKEGNIVDDNQLKLVIHKHIVGKITLERFHQYKEKQLWDKEESKRILTLIEQERKKLLPQLENNLISQDDYHKKLNKIGDSYRKYDISTLEYQPLISYLTLYYPDEMKQIIDNIKNNINEKTIDDLFDYYKDELPIANLNMAKYIVLDRARWIVDYYNEHKLESRKLL